MLRGASAEAVGEVSRRGHAMTAQSSGSSTPHPPRRRLNGTRMNLPDAPAQSDSQSRRRRPPPAQRLHSKCFTLPPCQTLHQAHKSSQRRRRRFHFPFFFCITVDEVKRPISGQRRKHTLDLARSGSRVGGEAGGWEEGIVAWR